MASSLTIATDKPNYAPGELVTLTAAYAPQPGGTFTVTVTAQAVNPADTADAPSATTSYTVTPPAPPPMAVTVRDDHSGTWAQTGNSGGAATFTQPAPAGTPAVPSSFAGAEIPAAALTARGVQAISWCGYTWEAEGWGTAAGQPHAANVQVDPAGRLILTAAAGAGGYFGAELDSARGDRGLPGNASTWGYGTYKWVIGTDLTTLPSPLVLGLFTYWSASKGGPAGQKEIDIELSGWGNPVPPFLQFGFYEDTAANETAAVPAEHCLIPGSQVPARSAPVTTVAFTWMPSYITWDVWYGTDTTKTPDVTLTATQGQQYNYTELYGGNQFTGTVEIPATGGQQVIMNLWSYGQKALTGSYSVIIESFSYTPSS